MPMNGYSYYYAENLQNAGFGLGSPWTPPSNFYVGLSTTECDPKGNGFTEPVGGAYARVSVTNTAFNAAIPEPTATDSRIENNTPITFPTSTASWGTVHYFGVFDNAGPSTTVYLLWGGQLAADKAIEAATIAVFQPTDLSVSSSNTP